MAAADGRLVAAFRTKVLEGPALVQLHLALDGARALLTVILLLQRKTQRRSVLVQLASTVHLKRQKQRHQCA